MSKDIGIGEIALIGGLGVGGLLLYKAIKGGSTTTPSQNWDGANELIRQLGEGNQKTLDSILAILGRTGNSDGSAGSSSGSSSGGTPTPSDDTDGDSIDSVKDLLHSTKTALDKLGYSGRLTQIKTITNEQVDSDRQKFASTPGIGTIDAALNSDIKLKTNEQLTGDTYKGVGLNATNLVNPTVWSKKYNQISNNLKGIYNFVTGKKNVDDDLAVS